MILINFFEWFKDFKSDKPWLIVGKGPSFDRLPEVDLTQYNVIGLNHVIYKIDCLLGSIIDIDVINKSEDKVRCLHIVTPWYPHINFKPTKKSIADFIGEPWCDKVDTSLWYNSSRSSRSGLSPGGPTVTVRCFNAVAVVNLLGSVGVKEVRTVGVDGGRAYSSNFKKDTLLSNGRQSFDCQKVEFKESKLRLGISVVPIFR
jgi:hypothetical protein